jgi:membrane fusion protein, multidrug efflux system
LQVGQLITLEIDSLGGAPLKAIITAKDGQIDTQSRNLLVRAEIANKDGLLKPGGFAHVRIDLSKNMATQTIAVPEAAIVPNGEQPQVWVVIDGKVAVKKVVIESRLPDGQVLISSGINEGDMVITGGHLKIGPGAPVMPLNAL